MSCQQVPRLTEDPYTFTETAPVTATIFNPQTHRLTPIVSNNATQKQLLTQKLQAPLVQTRVIHQPISLSGRQNLNARVNGLPHNIVNGFHKTVTVPHAAGVKIQQSQQTQLQTQSRQIVSGGNVGNVVTKKFLQPAPPPPVPSLNSLSFNQHRPLYTVKAQSSVALASPTASLSASSPVPLPPLFQKIGPPLGSQTLTSISTFPKQPNSINQAAVDQNVALRNHSNVNASRLIQVRGTTVPSASVTTLPNPGVPSPFPTPTLVPSHALKKPQQPLNIVSKIAQTATSVEGKPTVDTLKRKSSDSFDQSVFVAPAKRDSRQTPTGKKNARNQSSSGTRGRRSNNSSHHEALQRISAAKTATKAEWHAPDSYIFDNSLSALLPSAQSRMKDEDYDLAPCFQREWLDDLEIMSTLPMYSHITREQRIELRKAQLRRQAVQYIEAQKFHSTFAARKRLQCVAKALKKLQERDETPPPKKCCFPTCGNEALAMTAYCYLHITRNSDQYLFLPCTAKFSDNSQCRVPVFDISHELPLCREHAWKRDNYNRIVQEQKPKKPPRKRPKPSAMTRPLKRNKKKRKASTNSESSVVTTTSIGSTMPPLITKSGYELSSEEISQIISRAAPTSITTFNTQHQIHQDMLSICENSSAYESSEDTGVGGLSESELMVGTHEIAEEIPLGDTRLLEEHDLTNVLNQLPVDAFNELFTTVQQNGPLEPTQEEQEDLERALEAVNKQVKSLQQLTGGDAAFLGDFLDVVDDQILDDTDIAEVVLHSPNSSSVETDDTGNIILTSVCNSATASDIRGLVRT